MASVPSGPAACLSSTSIVEQVELHGYGVVCVVSVEAEVGALGWAAVISWHVRVLRGRLVLICGPQRDDEVRITSGLLVQLFLIHLLLLLISQIHHQRVFYPVTLVRRVFNLEGRVVILVLFKVVQWLILSAEAREVNRRVLFVILV
jgi:hypothetical protein